MQDLNTINESRLEKLPLHVKPPTYYYDKRIKNAKNDCLRYPPGHPINFTQLVYTKHGNPPSKGATMVLFGRVVQYAGEKTDRILNSLYNPLPIDHPKVQAWILELFKHYRNCYRDEYDRLGMLIYPIPAWKKRKTQIDDCFRDDVKESMRRVDDVFNQAEEDRAREIATVDNHIAVIEIRKWYPDFVPVKRMIDGSLL